VLVLVRLLPHLVIPLRLEHLSPLPLEEQIALLYLAELVLELVLTVKTETISTHTEMLVVLAATVILVEVEQVMVRAAVEVQAETVAVLQTIILAAAELVWLVQLAVLQLTTAVAVAVAVGATLV
jgi:hypothetical protein